MTTEAMKEQQIENVRDAFAVFAKALQAIVHKSNLKTRLSGPQAGEIAGDAIREAKRILGCDEEGEGGSDF